MANNIIDSIRLSGTTYQIQGGSIAVDTELDSGSTNPVQNKVIYNKIDEVEEVTAAGLNALNDKINPTVELTQAEYEALTEKDPNTYYIITDASAGDLTQYWTSAQTNSAITAAVSGKQDTLISGTNIKTINNESILGSGNIDIQGGGVDVVQTTGTSTTDVMSQDAVTTVINTLSGAIPSTYVSTISVDSVIGWLRFARFSTPSNFNYFILDNPKINGMPIHKFTGVESQINQFSLVETSAITTSVTSSSTDSQIPSAKAVYDAIQEGGGGGGGTVDQTIISGSTNAVAGGAVYDKIDEVEQVTAAALNNINDRLSEDEEVTAAGLNALNDNFGGMKLVKLSEAEYNALATKDSSTLYIIVN